MINNILSYFNNITNYFFNNDEFNNINPFKKLQITKEEFQKMNPYTYRSYFHSYGDPSIKQYEECLKNEKKSTLLLCYYMICNQNKFYIKVDRFFIKNKDHFYYTVVGDLDN